MHALLFIFANKLYQTTPNVMDFDGLGLSIVVVGLKFNCLT